MRLLPHSSLLLVTSTTLSVFLGPATALMVRHHYSLVSGPDIGFQQARSTVSGISSPAHCAIYCSVDPDCKSFMWDSLDRICTLGSRAVTNGEILASGSKALFRVDDRCPYESGYRSRSYETEVRCVRFSAGYEQYELSKETCAGDGGRLYKANSQDLIDLIVEAAHDEKLPDDYLRIGLDDTAEEDNFVWSDGQAMTSSERLLFDDGEPNQRLGEEDCIGITIPSKALHDQRCQEYSRYACEVEF